MDNEFVVGSKRYNLHDFTSTKFGVLDTITHRVAAHLRGNLTYG
jgi:hypothetical protein